MVSGCGARLGNQQQLKAWEGGAHLVCRDACERRRTPSAADCQAACHLGWQLQPLPISRLPGTNMHSSIAAEGSRPAWQSAINLVL